MKIAVSATGPTLESDIDPRFGRCQCFLIIETDTMSFSVVDNAGIAASGGAGIAAAQSVINQKVQAVITGNLGPNAHQVLSKAGVKVFTGISGKILPAVEKYNGGGLSETSGPTVEAHAGMSAPTPPPMTSSQTHEEIETLKGRANVMKQQLDNLMFRIEEVAKRQS